ncbi:uncharacterized protein METZ01_LOCUS509576, partial [marine metagenome]
LLPLCNRWRRRLRHAGVDRAAGVERWQDRHGRRIVRGGHAVAERTTWQRLADLHRPPCHLLRLLLGPGLSRRRPTAQRDHDLGHAHPRPHRTEHRVSELDRGLPLSSPRRRRPRRRPESGVPERLGRTLGLQRILGADRRREALGPDPGTRLQYGRLVRPLRHADLYQLQRATASRRLRRGPAEQDHRRPLAARAEPVFAHRRRRFRRPLHGRSREPGAALVRSLAEGDR